MEPGVRRDAFARDDGTTTMELVVGMSLMAVFMIIFTASITSMYASANKAESLNNSSGQLNQAFSRLDKEVRYASSLTTEGIGTDTNWYVEFLTTNTGTPICTQLRIDTTANQLQQRTWTVTGASGNTTASGLTTWVPIANGITNGGATAGAADQPFTFVPANPTLNSQQLKIYLAAKAGASTSATTSVTSLTFTAVNTDLNTPIDNPTTHVRAACNEVTRP
jgi:type II secretory pathway component PulJ